MNLTFREAAKDDANLLVDIYNSSFYDDYIRYGVCPGYGKSRAEMELSLEKSTKYIIICDNNPVGVISFDNKNDGNYYLGCLCIIPEYQGKGIGTQAFQFMLSVYSDWKRITLVTPADKKQNIRFYVDKCGFTVGNKEMDGHVEIVNFYMER